MKIDTMIKNADLFTMTGEGVGFVGDGAVSIDRGKIVGVGPTSEIERNFKADSVIDAKDMMVLPGFIDAHMHSYLAVFRGVAQDTNHWMMKGIRPFSSHVNKESYLSASKLNFLEALAAGTTTFCDYSDASVVFDIANFLEKLGARSCLTSNIRGVVKRTPVLDPDELYEFDDEATSKSLEVNVKLAKKWHGKYDHRFNVTLSPQGPDFLSKKMMLKVKKIAEEFDLKLHMHVAQGDRETIQMLKRYNKRSIPFLDEIGYLDERLIAVHLTDATDEETRYAAQKGVSMVLCSGSIGIIDGVVPPSVVFQENGGYVALGTDQAAGNNCNQIINEMKLTALFNKIKYKNPEVMPAWKVLRMATIEGAKAIGMDKYIGSIETGKKADIIFIDLNAKTMMPVIREPVRNHVPNLVYSARGNEIKRVMVDGETIYLDGRYLTVDEDEILAEVKEKSGLVLNQISEDDIKCTVAYKFMKEERL